MKIKTFYKPFEMNFIGLVWNLRIARHQFALWKNYEPVFNFRY